MTSIGSERRDLFSKAGKDEGPRLREFEELAMPLFQPLHNFARRLALNQCDAEDLVQETYLKAQRNFGSFQPGTNLRAWMFRILKNTFLSSLATLDHRMTDAVETQAELAVSPSSTTPESLLITWSTSEATRRAIRQLPDMLREVILLRDVNDASYREIAELLSIPMGTAMSRLARARRLVREALVEHRTAKAHRVRRRTQACIAAPKPPYSSNSVGRASAGVRQVTRPKEKSQQVV